MEYAKYKLRNDHTISLSSHQSVLPHNHNARDAEVLINRGPSFPVLTPDISKELVNETIYRRSNHKDLYSNNPKTFARKDSEDTKYYLDQLRIVKDYLGDMHPLKYDKDIVKRNYSSSRVKPFRLNENTNSFTDFLLPNDPTRARTTGFSSGHLRSKLQLNVYGPDDSKKRLSKIMTGEIPESPNIDRFSILDEHPILVTGNTITSNNLSNCNIINSPDKTITTNTSRLSSAKPLVGIHKNVLAGTLGYYGPALTDEERQVKSPKHISKRWLKSYFERVEEIKQIKEERVKEKERERIINDEGIEFKNSIIEFEQKLSISKINL